MTSSTFQAVDPTTGTAFGEQIAEASASDVAGLISRAVATTSSMANTTPVQRAAMLRAIAESIENSREKLIEITMRETALPNGRLTGELSRTVFQLEQFAKLVETGAHYQAIIDKPDAKWIPAPRPDIRKANQGLGVVGIFAASNFPFAFSVIGGDSASALAAGCPVVVKAHPSHPNTCRAMRDAVIAGLAKVGISGDAFALVEGINPEITHWIASHPDINAIGFTGSGKVGKILLEISTQRQVPIPVFAEMGSLNPVFFSSKVLAEKAEELAKAAIDSATLGSGQFCTKPGILIVPTGAEGDVFIAEIESYLATIAVAPLLNKGIADRFVSAITDLAKSASLKTFAGKATEAGFGVTPTVFVVDWADAFKNKELLEEHFGPTTIIIRADFAKFQNVAEKLEGQLTASLHVAAGEDVAKLVSSLTQLAGRVIMNGFPTAVAVTAAMQHGGQWPASSSHTTSVGLDSIYRFLRPVAFQNFNDELLPLALQEANPLGINRVING
jgi:2,5-dioxopentanoate dehydrogenase